MPFTPMVPSRVAAAALAGWLVVGLGSPGLARPLPNGQERSWSDEKCARYTKGWSELMARRGTTGLGETFLARHDAFLASGCLAKADVCPRSPEEFELANNLTILAMNAGTASTFLPFACRR